MNRVRIYSAEQRLAAGHPVANAPTLLYDGPGYLTNPARAWQRAAALEGIYGGSVLVHSSEDLSSADFVEVEDEYGNYSKWRVLGSAKFGCEWRLEVSSREVVHGS